MKFWRSAFLFCFFVMVVLAPHKNWGQTSPSSQTSASGEAHAAGASQYEIYAIRYATLPDFPVSALLQGADRNRKLDLAMIVWLVKGNGHTVLVDSGFYRDQFLKSWKVRDFVKPSDAVALLGIKPEEITDLVITHM